MILRPILTLSCILATTLTHAAESGFSVQWEQFDLDLQSAEDNRLVASGFSEGSTVVDAQTDPANPFSDVSHALYVNSAGPGAQWFRMHFRPFVGPPAETGAVAVQFQPGKNAVSLQVGSNDLPWDSANRDSIVINRPYFNVSFCLENGISIQGRSVRTGAVERLETGTPYTLIIKWDFSQGDPVCTFYLNGEAIQHESGEVFSWKITDPGPEPGINAFRITLGSSGDPQGDFFLGRLQAIDDCGDVWSKDWP